MNLSLQLGRALFAVGFVAIAGACAFAQSVPMTDADADAPSVARHRLEIVPVQEAKQDPHWAVASVRVGMPEQAAAAQTTQHVAVRVARNGDSHG